MSDEDSWEAALDSGDLDRRIAALVMGESDEANDDCVDETDATPAAVDSRARESRSTPQHESPEVSSHSSEDSEASVTHKTSDNSLSMPVMSLLDLPHDTIAAVLSFLPARDACALALTCSALRSAVHSDSAFLSSRWSLRTSGSRNARSARARLAAIGKVSSPVRQAMATSPLFTSHTSSYLFPARALRSSLHCRSPYAPCPTHPGQSSGPRSSEADSHRGRHHPAPSSFPGPFCFFTCQSREVSARKASP